MMEERTLIEIQELIDKREAELERFNKIIENITYEIEEYKSWLKAG